MNVADSERMESILLEQGMLPAGSFSEADLILINGCSVREKAVHKAVSALGRFRDSKAMIGLGGCVGQLEKDQLFRRAPYLDFVFGPDAIDLLPELIYRVQQGEKKVLATEFDRSKI